MHFSRCFYVSSDGEEVTCDGKSFHIHAPATGNVRRPAVKSLTAGTNRLSVVEDRTEVSRLSGAEYKLIEREKVVTVILVRSTYIIRPIQSCIHVITTQTAMNKLRTAIPGTYVVNLHREQDIQ